MKLDEATLDRVHRMILRRTEVDDQTGCWVWVGAWSTHHYAAVTLRGRHLAGHRLAAACYLGFDIDAKLDVWHRCNVRACCNPDHLMTGTRAEQVSWFRRHYPRPKARRRTQPCAS